MKTEVQEAIDQAKKALEGEDAEALRTANDHLSATAQKIGAAIYANTQPQADAANAAGGFGEGDSTSSDSSDDDVVDAEIVDDESGSTDEADPSSEQRTA